jgi:hypothetical protein
MSQFVKIRTLIREKSILAESLKQMSFPEVEVYEEPHHLFGFQGDQRADTAEVIVRRKFVGRLSNDIGFKLQESGEYQAIISEYDRRKYSPAWLQNLSQRYSYNLVKEQAREQSLVVEEEQELENGDIVILLSERG